jgi:hypothetical protein
MACLVAVMGLGGLLAIDPKDAYAHRQAIWRQRGGT